MSRGPGIWQRRIIDAIQDIDQDKYIPVEAIVRHHEPNPTRSHLVSARRAARRLAETDQAGAGTMRLRNPDNTAVDLLVVARPDNTVESNIFHGIDATPAWHNIIPGKYKVAHREWHDKRLRDRESA